MNRIMNALARRFGAHQVETTCLAILTVVAAPIWLLVGLLGWCAHRIDDVRAWWWNR